MHPIRDLEDSQDEVDIALRMLDLLGQSRLLITTRSRFADDLPVARVCRLNGLSLRDTGDYLRQKGAYQSNVQLEQVGIERLHKAAGSSRLFYQYLFAQSWRELGSDARRLWVYLARTTPASISRIHLRQAGVVEDRDFDETLESLMRMQLVENDAPQTAPMTDDVRFNLHPLARHSAQQVTVLLGKEIEPATIEFHRTGCVALAARCWLAIAVMWRQRVAWLRMQRWNGIERAFRRSKLNSREQCRPTAARSSPHTAATSHSSPQAFFSAR